MDAFSVPPTEEGLLCIFKGLEIGGVGCTVTSAPGDLSLEGFHLVQCQSQQSQPSPPPEALRPVAAYNSTASPPASSPPTAQTLESGTDPTGLICSGDQSFLSFQEICLQSHHSSFFQTKFPTYWAMSGKVQAWTPYADTARGWKAHGLFSGPCSAPTHQLRNLFLQKEGALLNVSGIDSYLVPSLFTPLECFVAFTEALSLYALRSLLKQVHSMLSLTWGGLVARATLFLSTSNTVKRTDFSAYSSNALSVRSNSSFISG